LTRLVGMQTAAQLQAALAIDPAGPWTQTHATALDTPPQTRLAPPAGSAGANWQALESPAAPAGVAQSGPGPAVEAMPSVAVADAIERAQAATVRLRVHDGTGHGVGTGTIIDTH